ncbi:unnamed protein product [Cuscuta europaea]|uniref:Calcium ion-binding protein n=1 Tax=Cuscuta europaea TaxID=41803 RepID=A0A9P0ZD25_CUSEU|nr:unnamed protein product [Cuscuta europaea]
MGLVMSLMGKGFQTTQLTSLALGTLYTRFYDKDVKSFQDFHLAILDIFNNVNGALPGKHYNVPTVKEIQACFEEWKGRDDELAKKTVFIDFMKTRVNLSKMDDTTLITGLVTPPVAMAAKRGGESVPQLKLIKAIPDVLFVPSATILALVSVKLSRKMFLGNDASS